jgi:hypothetical protein
VRTLNVATRFGVTVRACERMLEATLVWDMTVFVERRTAESISGQFRGKCPKFERLQAPAPGPTYWYSNKRTELAHVAFAEGFSRPTCILVRVK